MTYRTKRTSKKNINVLSISYLVTVYFDMRIRYGPVTSVRAFHFGRPR